MLYARYSLSITGSVSTGEESGESACPTTLVQGLDTPSPSGSVPVSLKRHLVPPNESLGEATLFFEIFLCSTQLFIYLIIIKDYYDMVMISWTDAINFE